ncbi:hypothetical protein [Streptomyces poonensis]|uniref:hypothetical protein n=1 Tax=Streptomyces poonensis TaxID=68255 RepID=UPI003570DC37
MSGVITASEPSCAAPFTGLRPRLFGKLVTVLRHEGADAVRRGRPWSLPLEDRVLLVVAVGRPLPGSRNDCKAWELSGAKDAVGRATVIADGGYRGTGLVIPHRHGPGQTELPAWKENHIRSHRKVRAWKLTRPGPNAHQRTNAQ